MSIQEVSDRLRVPKHTLRFWEKELSGIIVPHRTNGRQRRYSLETVSLIEDVKRQRGRGRSLAEIKRKLGNDNKGIEDNSNSSKINLLAERVAEVVKAEINRFFEVEAE